MTTQNFTVPERPPVTRRMLWRTDPVQGRARRRFYLLFVPVFLKILRLHFCCAQGSQFERLGRRPAQLAAPLPESWARWAAYRTGKLIDQMPIVCRRPCYWRSQMIYDLLPRFGFAVELHVGARLVEHQLTTHLWVSRQSVVLVDAAESAARYVELAVYTKERHHD